MFHFTIIVIITSRLILCISKIIRIFGIITSHSVISAAINNHCIILSLRSYEESPKSLIRLIR